MRWPSKKTKNKKVKYKNKNDWYINEERRNRPHKNTARREGIEHPREREKKKEIKKDERKASDWGWQRERRGEEEPEEGREEGGGGDRRRVGRVISLARGAWVTRRAWNEGEGRCGAPAVPSSAALPRSLRSGLSTADAIDSPTTGGSWVTYPRSGKRGERIVIKKWESGVGEWRYFPVSEAKYRNKLI